MGICVGEKWESGGWDAPSLYRAPLAFCLLFVQQICLSNRLTSTTLIERIWRPLPTDSCDHALRSPTHPPTHPLTCAGRPQLSRLQGPGGRLRVVGRQRWVAVGRLLDGGGRGRAVEALEATLVAAPRCRLHERDFWALLPRCSGCCYCCLFTYNSELHLPHTPSLRAGECEKNPVVRQGQLVLGFVRFVGFVRLVIAGLWFWLWVSRGEEGPLVLSKAVPPSAHGSGAEVGGVWWVCSRYIRGGAAVVLPAPVRWERPSGSSFRGTNIFIINRKY